MTDWRTIWPESIDSDTGEDASIGNEDGGEPISAVDVLGCRFDADEDDNSEEAEGA